jgi:hypothetical protein
MIALLMSEPFSRARWKKSSGDFFFGIADSRWNSLDEAKNVSTSSQKEERHKQRVPKYRRAMICEERRRRTARRLAQQPEHGRQVGRKKQKERGQQARLCTKKPGGGHGVGFASSFAPQRASSGPPPSCWGSSSKVGEFELVGCTKSHENRTSREQEGAVPEQWVRKGELE